MRHTSHRLLRVPPASCFAFRNRMRIVKDTQVENLCYGRQRGAARAREPALLFPRSQDGKAEKASSERRAGCP